MRTHLPWQWEQVGGKSFTEPWTEFVLLPFFKSTEAGKLVGKEIFMVGKELAVNQA
ncbi:MAG TPA: hypothetical protein VL495_02475 [Edaphobacter sp.]|nr:hypothetical protein [Edaphobacter sp.]